MAKSIMIQGTTSNAGKSFIVTGLCRIFAQAGYSVAPFKSQNMALNSYITPDGLELARAQAAQAEAAMIDVDSRMNPVLLKPMSDSTSQVILNGKPIGKMSAKEYYAYKDELIPHIRKAFDSLAEEYDIIVLEGAGSPAEINLRKHDIVNMGMAQMAGAPVLLAGDIDRGGVFASLYGTVSLLDEKDRSYIKAMAINKFRGDKDILNSGLDMLSDKLGIPFAGVIPYIDAYLDSEDSLSNDTPTAIRRGEVDVAIVGFPHISDAADFLPLEQVTALGVRYVSSAGHFGNPDLVILPGTKNTMGDLKWLRETGLDSKILSAAAMGRPIIGICGGYQMLQRRISDPYSVEQGGTVKGLELLDSETFFLKKKHTQRVKGMFKRMSGMLSRLNGTTFEGYETNVGQTFSGSHNDIIMLERADGKTKGDGMCHGNVYGSYTHGFFGSPGIVDLLTSILFENKGLKYEPQKNFNMKEYKNVQYNIIAAELKKALDMDMVYRILDEGV